MGHIGYASTTGLVRWDIAIMVKFPQLSAAQVESICRAVADTDNGLTGSEIGTMLSELGIDDPDPSNTKWRRLYNAVAARISRAKSSNIVPRMLDYVFDPARGLLNLDRYRWMMSQVNQTLMLSGVSVRDDGKFHVVSKATSMSEVQRRTDALRAKLQQRSAHPRVMACCTEELLANDYFHAVHEAAKSLCDHVREISGLDEDGSSLMDVAFSSKCPYVAINGLRTESERSEQNGLKELLKGVVSMVRNTTAHELRIRWDVREEDALDMLTEISYLHKLLDRCRRVSTSRPIG